MIYTATHIPLTIWILKAFFDTVPRSLRRGGRHRWLLQVEDLLEHHHAAQPPGLSVAGFLIFVSAWSEFLVPLVIAGNKDVAVASVEALHLLRPDQATAYTSLLAATLITVSPVVIGHFFAQRFIVSGLTAFADK